MLIIFLYGVFGYNLRIIYTNLFFSKNMHRAVLGDEGRSDSDICVLLICIGCRESGLKVFVEGVSHFGT